ncbi:hypothetical protein B0H16DRAFT_1690852 [Mycena metata]|uniref:Uncharacterized protein n=1 Tax=Mycena metata TaxID=1033252 RepID=A0AAD7J0A0_9AGAR|nr:hypothetical protein B0H16DRAFT_1690852 [Mycena metata]
MIKPLFKHFWELLQAYEINAGKESTALYVERLTSNYTNIPNIIQNGLHPGHPNLADSISCTSHFIRFSTAIGNEVIPLIDKVISLLPHSEDHQAKASFTVRLFGNHKTHSIPHPEALIAQTLEWLKTLDDPDLEATFYTNVGYYYSELDIPAALKYCQMGLSLAKSHGNSWRQSAALSMITWSTGDYIIAQAYAQEVQRLAKVSANLQLEAYGLYTEALCCQAWGDFRECIFLVKRASALLKLCDISGGGVLSHEGASLVNIAGVEVPLGVSRAVIQEKIWKEICHASCFANVSKLHWDSFLRFIILLIHSLGAKEKLGIYKALQFIGDVHLMQNDEVSAVSLFTVALDGFTYMDVHHSRAECIIRLGDIAKKNGDVLKALELWETAKPLFECSSQAKRVQDINERVGDISEETKEQYRKNLAQLTELNVPTGKMEEVDSDTEELGLEEEQIKLIAA